jgi:hypothetical protein
MLPREVSFQTPEFLVLVTMQQALEFPGRDVIGVIHDPRGTVVEHNGVRVGVAKLIECCMNANAMISPQKVSYLQYLSVTPSAPITFGNHVEACAWRRVAYTCCEAAVRDMRIVRDMRKKGAHTFGTRLKNDCIPF